MKIYWELYLNNQILIKILEVIFMRKIIFLIGTIFISLMLVFTSTAVPQTYSQPVMDIINEIEQQKTQYEETLSSLTLPLNRIFDFIKKLIAWIIQLLNNLIDLTKALIVIVGLVQYLIRLIEILFNLIQRVIDSILDLFKPDKVASIL
jgi:hypothetical protein